MKLAVIRMSGGVRLNREIKDAFRMLSLPRKFSCSVIEDNPANRGVLRKLKDHITFGVLDEATLALLKKREEKGKKSYRLHPPVGGFERKGTKRAFKKKGALGDRGERINDLITRMTK